MRTIFITILLIVFLCTNAQNIDTLKIAPQIALSNDIQEYKISDNLTYQYTKPKLWDFLTKLPSDFGAMGTAFIKKDNLIFFGASIGATAALIPADQQLVNRSRAFGEHIGFNENHQYLDFAKMIPSNINSGIYNLGNGFNMLLIGGGLLTYGLLKNDYRAITTSSEIAEGLIATGVFVQAIKRITGRESPFIAEKNGNPAGDWNPFPSFNAYAKNTPYYDAMPSGHLTTMMVTFTVITENYKEVKWIKPVGYSLMALTCFEMAQSKVHWYSDYPLAVFMGYIVGKSIVKNRIIEKKTVKLGEKNYCKPKLNYSFSSNNNYTVAGISVLF